ncbi:MAG: allantoinase PuuE [Alphaproteobacteria bacterium]|nr:allantoinase PuuE [Alphaproteobacteria bacterium]
MPHREPSAPGGRDLLGYADRPPHAGWPADARIAVNFVLNYEEGSEYSIPEGDGRVEVGLAETMGGRVPAGERDLAFESMYEFGSRVGFWRVMRLFAERHLPMTVFGCALALERNPRAVAAIVAAGHDICSHGWRWVEHFRLSEPEEREHIARAVATIARIAGERPAGWYCRYGPGANTRRLLVEEGGFLYDSDAYNDELPYWTTVAGRAHLVVPYTMDTNDAKLVQPGGFGTGDDFFAYLRAAFDQLYEEGEATPRMMSVGLHPRIVGRPARARALARFLDYVARRDRVWICRRIEIARHWIAHHPPGAA